VLPSGAEVRVRSIQVHNESVERAGLCQRVALNLTGAEKIELKRGDVLADDSLEITTARFDATLEIRPSAKRPLKNNERVRVFIGTAETLGRAIILDQAGTLAPKSRGLVQIVLDEPLVALSGDRFVVRDQTNVRTLGGGVVINPLGRRVRKPLEAYRKNLDALGAAAGASSIEALLNLQEALALTPSRIAQLLNLPIADVDTALKDARFVKLSMGDEEGFTTANKWAELKAFALAALTKHHAAEPLSPGLEMEALRSRLPYEIGARNYRTLADRLARETDIVREESTLRLKSHRVKLGESDGKLVARIEEELRRAGFQPPELKQLGEALKLPAAETGKLRSVLSALEREGKVVKIATDLYFARASVDEARAHLTDHLQKHPEITAGAYRDLLGASRKFAIALLDYFDHSGVTTRVGDARKLRAKAS
jgi:selenocysteine-specific elongation factor